MFIEWFGHACFRAILKNGTKVLFDPYDKTVGYPQQTIDADIVVISHDHSDHNDLSRVKGNYKVVKTQGVHSFEGLSIEGIKTWHDHSEGKQRGETVIFMLKDSGITLCHMGDIGCVPSKEVFDKLKGVDILLIPIGGHFTVDAPEALFICEKISPNIIIPMHFKTPVSTIDIDPVDDFLEIARSNYDVSRLGKSYLEIDRASLKKRPRIIVMEYA